MAKQQKQEKQMTDLARSSPAPLATQQEVPEYLRKAAGTQAAGLENINREDMTLPRLGLCQSMSPQRKRSDPKYITGLEEGDFFNTITQVVFGPKVKVVPLLFYKSRIRFQAMDEGGGILCQAPNGLVGSGDPGGDCHTCPMAAFKDGEKPECNVFYNYVSLAVKEGKEMPSIDDMVVASFKSSGLKAARDFNALLRLRNVDAFSGFYELASVEQKNSQGTWFAPTVKPAGWVSKKQHEAFSEIYRGVSQMAGENRIKVDMADVATEQVNTTKEM